MVLSSSVPNDLSVEWGSIGESAPSSVCSCFKTSLLFHKSLSLTQGSNYSELISVPGSLGDVSSMVLVPGVTSLHILGCWGPHMLQPVLPSETPLQAVMAFSHCICYLGPKL